MRVIYNGVDLMPIETHEYSWEAVYDDSMTDYLFSRVSIHVTALVNGLIRVSNGPFMSYNFSSEPRIPTAGPARPVPKAAPPNADLTVNPNVGIAAGGYNDFPRRIRFESVSPTKTVSTVRHRLESQRGQLFVFSGAGVELGTPAAGSLAPPPNPDLISLISPVAGRTCDAKNGPFPKIFNITAAMGDANTMVVDWGCETYVNEAFENNISPAGALLSNRFTQRHSVDDDGYTSLEVEGLAIFRADFLYQTPPGLPNPGDSGLGNPGGGARFNPDSDRAVLFMPIMQGFRRVINFVEPTPDAMGLHYGYTDTQVPVNFVAGPYLNNGKGPGASKINAVHSQSISSETDTLGASIQLVETTIQRMLNAKWLKGEGGNNPGINPGLPPKKKRKKP